MKRRRVALISLHFAEYVFKLAEHLAKDADVLLIIYSGNARDEMGEGWHTFFANKGVIVVPVDKPTNPLNVFLNARKIVLAVRSFGAELVHYQEALRDETFLASLVLHKLPSILTVHDPDPHSGQDSTRLRFSRYRIYRSLMRKMPLAAITHGSVLARRLVEVAPWFQDKVHVIAHGPLGEQLVQPSPPKVADGMLLFFGRAYEYKGLKFFIESVRLLRDRGHPVIGVVAGRGDDLERHRTRMEEAGCFDIRDRFIPVKEVAELFSQAAVVVLPYIEGTQSGVAAMALGFGRPVVASAVGSIPELVREQQNGLLVPPGNSTALAAAIETILVDGEFARRLAQGAESLRDGELSWGTIAKQTAMAYEKVLNQH